MKYLSDRGKPTILYPHSAYPPTVRWDGMYDPHPDVKLLFLGAPGHKEVVEAYGLPYKTCIVGWSYSPVQAFTPSTSLEKVVFAPIHPNHNDWLSDEDKGLNQQTFEILYKLSQSQNFQLKVRHLRDLQLSGLKERPGVIYVRGVPNLEDREIIESDLIVAHETYAGLSLALGKPTIMFGEDIAPRLGYSPETYTHAASWDKYSHIMMYPFDLLQTSDPLGLIHKALVSDTEVLNWKAQMIGQPFNPSLVVTEIEKLL